MTGRRIAGAALAITAVIVAAAVPFADRGTSDAAVGLRGAAEVSDGDTLRIGTERIRLHAIDAPESDQSCGTGDGAWPCGAVATARLETLVAGRVVDCLPRDRDRYGRAVSTCSADGLDLGGQLVAEGLARAYLRYGDDYAAVEEVARRQGLGLWRGEAEAPWEYRAVRRETARPRTETVAVRRAPEASPPDGCAIKGNISSKGQRVYHVPGTPSYASTRIDTGRGEAWFCTAADAEAAGFRPPKGP